MMDTLSVMVKYDDTRAKLITFSMKFSHDAGDTNNKWIRLMGVIMECDGGGNDGGVSSGGSDSNGGGGDDGFSYVYGEHGSSGSEGMV